MKTFYSTKLIYRFGGVEKVYSLLTDVYPIIGMQQFTALTPSEVEMRASALENSIPVCSKYQRVNDPWYIEPDDVYVFLANTDQTQVNIVFPKEGGVQTIVVISTKNGNLHPFFHASSQPEGMAITVDATSLTVAASENTVTQAKDINLVFTQNISLKNILVNVKQAAGEDTGTGGGGGGGTGDAVLVCERPQGVQGAYIVYINSMDVARVQYNGPTDVEINCKIGDVVRFEVVQVDMYFGYYSLAGITRTDGGTLDNSILGVIDGENPIFACQLNYI